MIRFIKIIKWMPTNWEIKDLPTTPNLTIHLITKPMLAIF